MTGDAKAAPTDMVRESRSVAVERFGGALCSRIIIQHEYHPDALITKMKFAIYMCNPANGNIMRHDCASTPNTTRVLNAVVSAILDSRKFPTW